MGPLVRARVTKGSCLLCERTSRRTQPAGIPFNSSIPSRNVHQVAEMISSASAPWSSSALPGDAVFRLWCLSERAITSCSPGDNGSRV